jgi:hypothetical protein
MEEGYCECKKDFRLENRPKNCSGQDILNIITAHTLQVGFEEYLKVKFLVDLKYLIQDIPQGENIFPGGI